MQTPERPPSRGLSPAGRTPSQLAPSPARPRTPLQWRDRDKAAVSDRSAWREEPSTQREVSYSVGTRPAATLGSSRTALNASRTDLQDGGVRAELQRFRAAAAASQQGERTLFDKLDQNHDGVLTRAEFAAGLGPSAIGADRAVSSESGHVGGDKPSSLSYSMHSAQELRRGYSPRKDEHDLPAAYLQDTRRELNSQHEVQRLQTTELRNTLASLQADAESLQREQRRQASAFKERKETAGEGDPQLSRKVDGMLAKVESQEQKFARLENDLGSACAAQRAQLAEALAQGRQLAKGLEEEGARRAATVAELQQVLQQGQRKDGLMASELQQNLTRATSMIQGQSGDWTELAKTIKSEVAGLAGAMKADRDARAIESASQRVEIARMIDNARRANVCDTVETYLGGSSSEYGQDMMSRAGAVAVRKMVDTTKALLHGLEEALILRAGFIAGVFHTWRCEATLWKVGRRYQEEFTRNQDEWEAHLQHHRQGFEDELRQAAEHHENHQERIQTQKALLLDSWAYGEAVGLVRETMRYWRKFAEHEQKSRRTAARIHSSILQWVEGKDKGTVHACYMAWRHWTLVEAETRKRDSVIKDMEDRQAEEIAKAHKKAEKRVQEGLAQLETIHKGAKKDLEVVIAKWEKGSRRGLLMASMRGWDHFRTHARKRARHSQAVQLVLHKWLEGKARGVKHTCWMVWKSDVFASKAVIAERKKLEELLNGDRAERENQHKRDLDDHKNKVEGAKESVKLMVDKWVFGQSKGLKLEVFQVWAKYAIEQSNVSKRCASVEMSLNKWVEGERRGDIHACFLHWKAHSLHASVVKRHQAVLDNETAKMRDYLQDAQKKHAAEVDYIKGEAARRKDAAHKSREYIILKWEMGNRKGTLLQVLKCWHKAAKDCHRHGVQRAAVHQSLLKAMEGGKKAAVHMTFVSWQGMMQEARKERDHEDALRRERAHWEAMKGDMEKVHDQAMRGFKDCSEERRLKALAVSEASIMKWMVGEKKGLLRSVLLDWKRYKEAVRASKRKSLTVQASMLRALEGEKRSLMQMSFTCWKNLTAMESSHTTRIDQLTKQVEGLIQRHEVRLAKYATMLGSDQEPVLMGWVFQMWKEISQGIKYLEQERATEVKLEEMRKQHELQVARKREKELGTLRALGMKDDHLLVYQVYEAWKVHFEKAQLEYQHELNQKQVINKYADYMIMKKFQKDAAAILASSFAEWHREAMILKHERHQDDLHRRIEEHSIYSSQMEQRMAGLEENLMMAYRQIDHITETLQKELQTKEELTVELRDAYDKMRKSCFTPMALTPTTAVNTVGGEGAFSSWPSRPGSAQSRGQSAGSVQPGRPARLSGASNRDGLSNSQKFDQDLQQESVFERGFSSSLGVGQSADSVLRGSRANSPSRCDWDHAVLRMREEGIMRTESSGRI